MRSYVPFYPSLLPTPFLPFRAAERLFLIDVSIITQPHPVVKNQLLQFRTSAPARACFITLPNASLPFLCVVTKLHFLLEQENFFKKALVFFCEKCYLVSNRSVSWIQSETTRFPLRHSCCSSFYYYAIFFIYLLIIYPVLKRTNKKRFPTCTGERFLFAAHHRKAPCTFHGTGRFAFPFYSAATAALSSSTRSVFSHFTPRSSRPMWP